MSIKDHQGQMDEASDSADITDTKEVSLVMASGQTVPVEEEHIEAASGDGQEPVLTQHISLWRNRDFMLLWSGQAVSMVGTEVSQFAFPLLVLALTATPALAGLTAAIGSLPYLCLSLFAGALV